MDGGSILRPEIFAEMKGEVQRGLSKQVRSDDPMESRQTLADYLIFSDENHFTAIDVRVSFLMVFKLCTLFLDLKSYFTELIGFKQDVSRWTLKTSLSWRITVSLPFSTLHVYSWCFLLAVFFLNKE